MSEAKPPAPDLSECEAARWLRKKGWESFRAGGKVYFKSPYIDSNQLLSLVEALNSQFEKELTQ